MEPTFRDVLKLKNIPREGLDPNVADGVTRVQMFVRNQNCSEKTYEVIEAVRSFLGYNIQGLADLIKLAPQIEAIINVPDHSRVENVPPTEHP